MCRVLNMCSRGINLMADETIFMANSLEILCCLEVVLSLGILISKSLWTLQINMYQNILS